MEASMTQPLNDTQKENLANAVKKWVYDPVDTPIAAAMQGFKAQLEQQTSTMSPEQKETFITEKYNKLTKTLADKMILKAEDGGDFAKVTKQEDPNTESRGTFIDTISQGIGFISSFFTGIAGKVMGFVASLPGFKQVIGQWVDNSKSETQKASDTLDSQAAGVASIPPQAIDSIAFGLNEQDQFLLAHQSRAVLSATEALHIELPAAALPEAAKQEAAATGSNVREQTGATGLAPANDSSQTPAPTASTAASATTAR
jgi:hypothetical protein